MRRTFTRFFTASSKDFGMRMFSCAAFASYSNYVWLRLQAAYDRFQAHKKAHALDVKRYHPEA